MGMTWGICYHLALYILETRKDKFKHFKWFFTGMFITTWIGAKLVYLLTMEIEVVKKAAIAPSFWLGGGFVFYGGLILGLLYVLIFSKITKQHMEKFNFLIPVLCLGHSLGRIGCLLAGCCFGSATDFPLSIHMHGAYRHPVQLYESVALFILFLVSFELYKRGKRVVIFYLGSYSIIRFLLEYLRGDEIRGEQVLWLFSTSQLIALFILAIVIANSKIFKFKTWARS